MNVSIISMVICVIGFAILLTTLFFAEKKIPKFVGFLTSGIILLVGIMSVFGNITSVQDLTNDVSSQPGQTKVVPQPKNSSTPVTNANDVLSKLVSLTNKHNPGDNKNYYWENGTSRLANDSDVEDGQVVFTHDDSGRPAIAKGKLTYEMYKDSIGSRQGTPLNPSGDTWPKKNPKTHIDFSLTGRTYNGYFYNRSHSIADSLAGTASYKSSDNFTTGTRSQNVGADQNGGMRAAEETVENYWKTHPNSSTIVEYQTTPVYNGSEKLPRGSVVDIKSSDGAIDKEFVIINDAEGWNIDYNDGTITLA